MSAHLLGSWEWGSMRNEQVTRQKKEEERVKSSQKLQQSSQIPGTESARSAPYQHTFLKQHFNVLFNLCKKKAQMFTNPEKNFENIIKQALCCGHTGLSEEDILCRALCIGVSTRKKLIKNIEFFIFTHHVFRSICTVIAVFVFLKLYCTTDYILWFYF